MLTDPQSITVNAVAKSMPRIQDIPGGTRYRYRTTTDEYQFDVQHRVGKITGGEPGETHTVRCRYTVFATAVVPKQVFYVTLQLSNGDGMDLTQARYVSLAVCAWAVSATIDRLFIGES